MALQDGYPQVLLFIRLDEFAAGMCAGAYALARPLTRITATAAFWGGLIVLLATPWVFAGYDQVGHYYDFKGFLRPPWIQIGICLMLLGLTGGLPAQARMRCSSLAARSRPAARHVRGRCAAHSPLDAWLPAVFLALDYTGAGGVRLRRSL